MGAAPCGHRQPAARQGHPVAQAAAMITHELFTFTAPQWKKIRKVIYRARGLDADQIERQVTVVVPNSGGKETFTGMQPLRERIEIAVGQYRLYSAVSRLRLSRAKLMKLRKAVKKQQASIVNAVSVPLDVKYGVVVPLLLHSVDGDILKATSEYFGMLLRYLDRLIAQAGSPHHGARKIARDQCWSELLTIWCDLGGKPHGTAAAKFLRAASLPVMRDDVALDPPTIVQWLKRRRRKTAKQQAEPLPRRVIA